MEKEDWKRLVENLIKANVLRSSHVIKAMRSVPRANFIPENMRSYSTTDTPLPTGFGQTISAPHSLSIC